MLEISVFIFAAVALATAGILFYRSRKTVSNEPMLLIQHQLEAVREQLRSSLEGSSQQLSKTLFELTEKLQGQVVSQTNAMAVQRKSMDERLDNAARVIGDVHKSIGKMTEAVSPITEIRDILKAPKLRGNFGEIMLENLLEEMMPVKFYETQFSFSDGERVDAVIKLGGQMVSVDSKFPLEKYQEYLNAKTDEEKKNLRRQVISVVKKHILNVAKYIRPDEGTYPFALMYIPSENVYYELFVGNTAEDSLWPAAVQSRVFPVSSNTIYLYLQTISFGLRGMKIAEDVQELFNKLEKLGSSIEDIKESWEKLGTHLKNAQKVYELADKKLGKFEDKFAALSDSAVPALPAGSKEEKEEEPLIQ